jgi:hypothetical protein
MTGEKAMNLPALCDEAIRDLAEARDIEAVQAVRERAELMRMYAKQRELGAQALNRCTKVVALAEKKIGEEVEKGRAEGTILKARQNRSRNPTPPGGDAHQVKPASLAEIGLTKQQNRDFGEMAKVPAEVIHQVVDAATAEGRPVTKAEIKRAAGVQFHNDSKAKPKAKPKIEAPPPQPRRPQLVHDSDDNLVIQMLHLIRNVADVAKEIEPEVLFRKTPEQLRHNLDINLQQAAQFVAGLHAAWLWSKQQETENAAGWNPAASA